MKLILIKAAAAVILLLQAVNAYNNDNRLVRCWDELVVFNETTNEKVGAWNMTAFPYIDGVSTFISH